ncbi:hypothetical protein [uncultured Microbacterium sp.]|uniref:hypothetical protein n=1 Tax=uncultured Microbacterium sp. TaxID=191216 RepID=UPI002615240C|nr:hypothetical protein [uncultured Microbacterium sp.]
MSAKHRHPDYQKNARIIRQRVAVLRRGGGDVTCWRCGHDIDEEQRYDVGHIDPDAGHDLGNLAPEHRYKTARCIGNRAAGGKLGAARQQARAERRATTSTDLLDW